MSLHRRAARRDDNEAEIVKALRTMGVTVIRVSGPGLPDLIAAHGGVTYLLGVKRPPGPKGGDLARRKDKPTGDERPADWDGGPWQVVTSVAEAVAVFGFGHLEGDLVDEHWGKRT